MLKGTVFSFCSIAALLTIVVSVHQISQRAIFHLDIQSSVADAERKSRPTASVTSNPIADDGVSNKSTWDDIRSCLCPNSIPQADRFGAILFKLARYEIDLEKSDRDEAEEQQIVRSFFQHPMGVWAYYRPTDDDEERVPSSPLIYVDNKKAASTQIKYHFHDLGLERANLNEGSELNPDSIKGDEKVSRSTTTPTEVQKQTKEQTAVQVTDDVCILTAVRDPIERFLSGAGEVEHRSVTKPKYNATLKKLDVRYKQYGYGEKRRFEQLVKDFLSSPGLLFEGGEQDYGEFFRHLWGQTRILTNLHNMGKHLTSYLPTIENVTVTWPKLILHNCPSASDYVAPSSQAMAMEVQGRHSSSKDIFNFRLAANSVWEERGPTARALCALHAMEYACWDRLPQGVPEICADVYSSHSFVSKIENGCRKKIGRDTSLTKL